MKLKQHDLVVHLGSQVKYIGKTSNEYEYELAPHTEMRTRGTSIALLHKFANNAIICGGSNFGVRYDDSAVFNAQHPSQKTAIFTFKAIANADFYRKSEAAVIKDRLVHHYGIASERILAETLSTTTKENVQFLQIILRRTPAFSGNETVAVTTQLYQMGKALQEFREAGMTVDPLFTENLLVFDDSSQIDVICEYYSTPKGGKPWPVEEIRKLLTDGQSLVGLLG